MPCPSEVPRSGRQALDRREHRGLVVRRRLDRQPGVAERDDADDDAGGLALDEGLGGRLGRVHPGRLEVVGRHAARDVEGEDDRALRAGQADRGLRPGQGDHQDGQSGDEQDGRDPGTQAKGPADRRLAEAQAGANHGPASSPLEGAVQQDPERHERHREEHRRPDERHG